jgi:serine/threonine protein kinase/Tfp pilus assembly protein PilF
MTDASVREDVSLDSLVAQVVDEFRECQKQGQRPDVAEYAARYPQAAELLRKVLGALELMEASLVGPLGQGDGLLEAPTTGVLGDFRLLREAGKGGMGIVYEAEQVSLGRRVALKVLPLAATMDPRQLQRFHKEARAAACLHHTNIVPVHGVGCERGVHYYAMQFIDGQSLAAFLEQQRGAAAPDEPTTAFIPALAGPALETAAQAAATTVRAPQDPGYFRRVAGWGIQAAEALDHAHQMGIIHRDVKPANLMVDGIDRLWVTDFGLAQVQSDTRLTMTGDLVGTLRYMSPEQALAKRVVVDHRTDVYSLGATLYELLTLRPAFGGTDRQELLRQIAFEEPVPPRRVNRRIPAELETIVLRALEKNPAERYATAQELADDLGRHLRDEPTRARRPGLARRARKWARRHRALVAGVAAALLVGLTVLAGSLGWAARDRAARRAQSTEVIMTALEDADSWQKQRRLPEALSAARRADGLLAGAVVDESLRQRVRARLADLELLDRLEGVRLEQQTALRDGNFDWKGADELYGRTFGDAGLNVETLPLEEAVARLRKLTVAAELAGVLDHWAMVRHNARGSRDRSWTYLVRVARHADPDPRRARVREALEQGDRQALLALTASEEVRQLPVATLSVLGHALMGYKTTRRQTETFLREAQRRHPNDFWLNHMLFSHFADMPRPQGQEAVRFAALAVGLRPQSPGTHQNLSLALHWSGKLDEAVAECREAVRIEADYAEAHSRLCFLLWEQGKVDDAIAEGLEAVRLRNADCDAHNNLGVALRARGRHDEAVAQFRTAIQLNKDAPDPHNNLGIALGEEGRLHQAIEEYRAALQLKHDYPEAHSNLGWALAQLGRLEESIAEFREALRLRVSFVEARCMLGEALLRQGHFAQAAQELRLALGSRNPGWPHAAHYAPLLRNAEDLARLDARLPALLKGEERPKDVSERLALAQFCQIHKKLFAAAVGWYGEAFAAQPELADDPNAYHRYNAASAAALAGCGQGQDAARLSDQARVGMRKQALKWLRADLEAWRRRLDEEPTRYRPAVARLLAHWLANTDFAGVRGEQALGKLQAPERQDWQMLWTEAADLLARAQAPRAPQKKPGER